MPRLSQFFLLIMLSVSVGACKEKYQVLVPKPLHHFSKGDAILHFGLEELDALKSAALAKGNETYKVVEAQLLNRLPSLGQKSTQEASRQSTIEFEFLHELPLLQGAKDWQPIDERDEAYTLVVAPGNIFYKISMSARSHWALANAMSTLYQLMEIKRASHRSHGSRWTVNIPGCPHAIEDRPAFPYRGLLLDTARSFYPVRWLKKLIVQLTQFKFNVLHLHLTDTVAWSFDVGLHPQLSKYLSYRSINGAKQSYSRQEIQDLVEFARLRGMSLLPEVDGPVHAPNLASEEPLKLTVATSVMYESDDWGAEPPVGTWDFVNPNVTSLLRDVFWQLEQDFSTAPFLHVGGDEPKAAALCALLGELQKIQCYKECTDSLGGSRFAEQCKAIPTKGDNAELTYWFPDVLNAMVQHYYQDVVPQKTERPIAAWSGVRADMAVRLPRHGGKPALQLWEFPQPGAKQVTLSEEDCEHYHFIQSSATHPLKSAGDGTDHYTDEGWMYLECGEGQNWITMGKNYWCSRASWVTMYLLNLTSHSSIPKEEKCQKAFIGGEIAIWGEITGPGIAMSLIFPRAVAFAERVWTNPPALSWDELTENGGPPRQYWDHHLKGALHRLNTVVENFALQGTAAGRLQPEFCREHPEHCDHYTESKLPPLKSEELISAI